MNIEFLVTALIVGKAVDWIIQSQQTAERKSKDSYILTQHAFTYSIWTSSIVFLILPYIHIAILFFYLFITHWIIDTRKTVKFIMYLKGIRYDEMDTKYAWLQISIDQILHELAILVLSLVI